MFVIFVVTGIGGFRGGWLWAPAIAAAALAAVGWWGGDTVVAGCSPLPQSP